MRFCDLSIRHKLAYISLIISGIILVLVCIVFAINDYYTLKSAIIRNTITKGTIVAFNVTSAVQFDDPISGGDILSSLRADSHIIAARIYDHESLPFITYYRPSAQQQDHYQALRGDIFAYIASHEYAFSEEGKNVWSEFFSALDKHVLLEEQRLRVQKWLAENQTFPDALQIAIERIMRDYDHGLPRLWNSKTLRFTWQQLIFSTPITHESPLGFLYLVLDQEEIKHRVRSYAMIILSVILGSIVLAYLLAAFLQRGITRPILELANLTRNVSENKNYALRAEYQSGDELGVLAKGFNNMLQAIQERDEKLERYNAHLEKTVAKRTAELKKLNIKLSFQAYHDALTNLPNRAKFVQQATESVSYSRKHGQVFAMLFIDLDNFKYINDTLGHSAGDRIIQEVAKRLTATTRESEDLVARLGGDEFTVLLHNLKSPEHAGLVAEKITRALATPFRYNGQDLYITPSIGISLYPDHGKDVGTLMRNADTSLFQAKRQGRNSYRYYSPESDQAASNRLRMENQLRQALHSGEFEVWYQPRFQLSDGKLVGAEALVRWRSPDLALISPAEFIPLAEDTGLIVPIGEWVLQAACADCHAWQQPGRDPLPVSVNLSARQFAQEDLLDKIGQLLKQTRLEPGLLELELTETLIMPNAEETVRTLRKLKEMNTKISIDDFGTGYSSLSYLQQFPIDILKIDQSFLLEVRETHRESALVSAIISMAHNLNLQVVAEGVETQVQFEFLQKHHCDQVQGYLFGKPVPSQIYREVLHHHPDMHSFIRLVDKVSAAQAKEGSV